MDTKAPAESSRLIEILDKNNINGFGKPGGTDKADWHSYTGVYELIMNRYSNQEAVNLLEIGVLNGGSSLLWQNVLENANIHAVDILDNRHSSIIERLDASRYSFYQMDAYAEYSRELLFTECPEGFDIIIDDGPHTLESQIACIKNFLPILKPGGVMIIEDIQDQTWINVLMRYVPIEYTDNVEVFDFRPVKNQYDDILFVINKPSFSQSRH